MSNELFSNERYDAKTNKHSSHRQDNDTSKLSRQHSSRAMYSNNNDRDGKLGSPSTFHQDSAQPSSLARRSSYYISDQTANLSRKTSMPHNLQRLSDSERKERKRRQNTESARRTRERKKAELKKLEKVYDANEIRIQELELIADDLSRELRRHNTISDPRREAKRYDPKEERPKWFGAPF